MYRLAATRVLREWVSSGDKSFFQLFSPRSIWYHLFPQQLSLRVSLSSGAVPQRRLCTPHTATAAQRLVLHTSSSYLFKIYIDVTCLRPKLFAAALPKWAKGET